MNVYLKAFLETAGMTLISTFLSYLVGLPLGVLLAVTGKNGLHPKPVLNGILSLLVNVLRSIPCLLLIILLIPLNRLIFQRATGEWYVLVLPLFVASFAYVARVVEQSLSEVRRSPVEAAKSLGATDGQIIRKVLLVEARPSLLLGLGVTTVTLLGYTSFAYDFGAGGLIAQAYSIYHSDPMHYLSKPALWIVLLLIVALVQGLQELSLLLAKKADHRVRGRNRKEEKQ